MASVFPHPLCDRTVTVYRCREDTVSREVFENCYYACKDVQKQTEEGVRFERTFLLMVPGDTQTVFPGDRIFDGEGPVITAAEWERFLPSAVPGLSEAAYACVHRWDKAITHTEAGRK